MSFGACFAYDALQLPAGGVTVGRDKNASQIAHDFAFHLLRGTWASALRMSCEPAALPGHAVKASLPRFLEAGVRVARD